MHQGFVPHYRVGFFEQLAARPEVEYVVAHGTPPPGTGHFSADEPFAFAHLPLDTRDISVAGRSFTVLAARPVLRGGFDVLVLGTHLLLVTNHLLFLAFKARGRPVLYWGHGKERTQRTPKRWLAHRADHYLAYTSGGAQWVIEHGMPADRVTVVRNTLDMSEQQRLRQEA